MSRLSKYSPPAFSGTVELDLSRNEGRAPAPDTIATPGPTPDELSRYPALTDLRDALATTYQVDPEHVLVTAGVDDALLRTCLAWLGPGATALIATPTFEMIPRYVNLTRARLDTVGWPEGPFPTNNFCTAITPATRVAFVVSPNNPTGATATADDLRQVAAALTDGIVVLDAAYAEFGDSAQDALVRTGLALPNVIVTRTLSKAWGLAGLRVGCALGNPEQLRDLSAAGNPMPTSIASAHYAVRRLSHGKRDLAEHVTIVRKERAMLIDELIELGLRPATPSQANFVMVRGVDANWFTNSLAALGIAIRRFPNQPDLTDAVRIGLPGDPAAFRRLLHALRTAHSPGALLFDMDGVLADVSKSYRRAIRATAASFGVEVSDSEIAAKKAKGNANDDWRLTHELLLDAKVATDLATVTERFEARYLDLRHNERLMVDAPTLRRWRRRFPLAVVTGRPRADAEYFLRQFGIRDLFDEVICREDAPLKPDPAPVRLALERLGTSTAWMLGDTPDDREAARAAGVLPITVGPPDQRAAATLLATSELDRLLP